MKYGLRTLFRLLLAFFQDGQDGLAQVWHQHTARSLCFSQSLAIGAREDRWQALLALGLGLTGVMWLLFFGVIHYHQSRYEAALQPTCQLSVLTTQVMSPAPIPLNLERLADRIEMLGRRQGKLPEGKVCLLVKVDQYGRYEQHQILYSEHRRLEEYLDRVLLQLVCLPARHHSESFGAWLPVNLEVSRRLP
jgi:hypothetical protein